MVAIAGMEVWKVLIRICPPDRATEDRIVAVQAVSAQAAIDIALDWWGDVRKEVLSVERVASVCLR